MRRVAGSLAEYVYFAALTLWVGGVWSIGYIVAPILFATLDDKQLAGLVAGKMFTFVGWIGLGCGVYVLLYSRLREEKNRVFSWCVFAMLVLTVAMLFGIQPLMAQLKLQAFPLDVMQSPLRARFVFWHGLSSVLYLLQSLLGIVVATLARPASK
ncbi:DUF4149 domain-containing protein [Propionivibrio soli]|uniref:DUF4149 domain-containing protein n=1 Tax=Propionivibrio soli TaxID=2976531 RepID=UPI0021E76798|nr:DUF4149 domain-containing protein [Propionivibrio soli]